MKRQTAHRWTKAPFTRILPRTPSPSVRLSWAGRPLRKLEATLVSGGKQMTLLQDINTTSFVVREKTNFAIFAVGDNFQFANGIDTYTIESITANDAVYDLVTDDRYFEPQKADNSTVDIFTPLNVPSPAATGNKVRVSVGRRFNGATVTATADKTKAELTVISSLQGKNKKDINTQVAIGMTVLGRQNGVRVLEAKILTIDTNAGKVTLSEKPTVNGQIEIEFIEELYGGEENDNEIKVALNSSGRPSVQDNSGPRVTKTEALNASDPTAGMAKQITPGTYDWQDDTPFSTKSDPHQATSEYGIVVADGPNPVGNNPYGGTLCVRRTSDQQSVNSIFAGKRAFQLRVEINKGMGNTMGTEVVQTVSTDSVTTPHILSYVPDVSRIEVGMRVQGQGIRRHAGRKPDERSQQ